ncbi:hypothetical protein DMB42_52145 [Nonomuraea sp. WAC 01424]|nr:hypothetical protein DMB42_52145 [Nonomuraea sp. WAC 01424]
MVADKATPTPHEVPNPWSGVHLPSPVNLILAVLGLLALIGLAHLLYRAVIAKPGFATAWEIHRKASARSAKRMLPLTRPSLVGQRAVQVDAYSYLIGRAWSPFMCVRCTPEDSALIEGPPGVGKSLMLANAVRRAPGAVLYTSSKIGDYDNTAADRAKVGPVFRFNPLGLGGVPSDLRIDPVKGCRDLEVASRRGAALLYGARRGGESPGSLTDYFENNANIVLRSFLLAADLAGKNLLDVYRWASTPSDDEALRILIEHDAPANWIEGLEARHQITQRTRDGIFSTLEVALSWVTRPAASYVVTPGPGEALDWNDFLANRGTLYMFGEDSPAGDQIAPLFTLVITDLIEHAISRADRMPRRRLDPFLMLALDEAATICRLPLPSWVNTLRGHGILPLIGIQSKSQLYQVWGQSGGDAIWNAVAATVTFGGLKAERDLQELSSLCGDREVIRKSVQHGPNGPVHSETTEHRPVMTPRQIRQLRRGYALVLYRDMAPVKVRVRRGLRWRPRPLPPVTPGAGPRPVSASDPAVTAPTPSEVS